jgi:hypothetical protein
LYYRNQSWVAAIKAFVEAWETNETYN